MRLFLLLASNELILTSRPTILLFLQSVPVSCMAHHFVHIIAIIWIGLRNHCNLINKTNNVMQFGAIVFIIPWKAIYMFRGLFTPIIRSVLKMYMQLLVQSVWCQHYA
jgi:hypothetical protein